MKKTLLFIIMTFLVVSLVQAQDNDIRKLKWGMGINAVKKIENLGDDNYKEEELLGSKVEVIFNCDKRGLYAVTYVTNDINFVDRVKPLLDKKYGEPGKGIDYSFLMEQKRILTKHAKIVVEIVAKNDYSGLNQLEASYGGVDERKVIKAGLSTRKMWSGGKTVALMLDDYNSAVLSYRPKQLHEENKKKFEVFIANLKSKVKKDKKASESSDNF